MPQKDIKIGNLYYVFNADNKDKSSITICNILSYPRIKHETVDNKPELLGRVIQHVPFMVLELGPEISPFNRLYGEYYPMWIKILYNDVIGWIKIDSDRIEKFEIIV